MDTKRAKDLLNLVKKAKKASLSLAQVPTSEKNRALNKMADAILLKQDFLMKENRLDIISAKRKNYPVSLIDRLILNEKRIKDMAQCLKDTAKLKDPVGDILDSTIRPNGLVIKKIRVPIGVVAIVYESRPNVTADCIGLCLKSGNAVILKGGKEAAHSNAAIFKVCQKALEGTELSQEVIQMVSSLDRKAVASLLTMDDFIDLVIPRGGEGLIRFVAEHSRIPVIKHYKGVCHIYVSAKADLEIAEKVCFNAKVQRPGVCNAMEKMLVQRRVAAEFLPPMIKKFQDAGVEIRADAETRKLIKGLKIATQQDWFEEYLDKILTVKIVEDLHAAIEHINTFGSHHSDGIITENAKEIEQFFKGVDSACLYANASTRFTDGYEFGFGAEVGISTDKIHARGPMGLEGLTTYKYVVSGNGQIRE